MSEFELHFCEVMGYYMYIKDREELAKINAYLKEIEWSLPITTFILYKDRPSTLEDIKRICTIEQNKMLRKMMTEYIHNKKILKV